MLKVVDIMDIFVFLILLKKIDSIFLLNITRAEGVGRRIPRATEKPSFPTVLFSFC